MNTQEKAIYSNCNKLNLIQLGFSSFALSLAAIVPFLQSQGFSQREVLLSQGILIVCFALCQVPTGHLADRFGRARAITIAGVHITCGVALFLVGGPKPVLILGELMMGIGVTFNFGADTALLFDSLAAVGKEELFPKKLAVMQSIGMYAIAVYTLLGGYLADIQLDLPFKVFLGLSLAIVPIGLSMKEPPHVHHEEPSIIASLVKAARHPRVRWTLGFPMFIFGLGQAGFWLFETYLEELGFTTTVTGIVLAVLGAIAATSAAFAPRVSRLLRERPMAKALGVFLACGYLMLGILHQPIAVIFAIPQQLVMGYCGVVFTSYLNREILPNERATFASLQSMCGQIAGGIFIGVVVLLEGILPVSHFEVAAGICILGLILIVRLFAPATTKCVGEVIDV